MKMEYCDVIESMFHDCKTIESKLDLIQGLLRSCISVYKLLSEDKNKSAVLADTKKIAILLNNI